MFKKLLTVICRKKAKSNYDFSNISSALFRPLGTALGDAIVITAAFKQLKTAFPSIKIGVIVSKRNEPIFRMCPLVDEIITDKLSAAFKERKKWQLFFDYMDCFSSHNIIYDKILSPDYIVCFEKRYKKYYNQYGLKNYDIYCRDIPPTHLSEWLTLTPLAQFSYVKNPEYVLASPEPSENPFLPSNKLTIFLVIEGSTRLLPLKMLQDLITETAGNNVNWVIANTSHAQDYFDSLKHIGDDEVVLAPKTSLQEFVAYIYFADVVISIDTSAVHIACAFQKPLIALYANSTKNLTRLKPLKYKNAILVTSPKKTVESNDEFRYFTAQDILEKATEFLKNGWKNK